MVKPWDVATGASGRVRPLQGLSGAHLPCTCCTKFRQRQLGRCRWNARCSWKSRSRFGRRNWTVAGSDYGGQPVAAIYSLIETAKLNGPDPEAYVPRVLKCIADHSANCMAELLP